KPYRIFHAEIIAEPLGKINTKRHTHLKINIYILIIFSIVKIHAQNNYSLENGKISLTLPENWKYKYSVIYNEKNEKIGEKGQGLTEYISGKKFIQTYKNGFVDDPETTKFIKSDTLVINDTRWYYTLRKSEFWDGKGNTGFWYNHNF